jgi:ABC-type transport system involved in cytochrome bd biosynthesis fused ATPase/permease subunit
MLLEVKNLYFNYQTNQPLFQNLNLNVDEGHIIARQVKVVVENQLY